MTSQNGEDGILLHIFDLIGTTDRVFVEFGIADGRECNTRHLAGDFGWRGLAMDCSPDNIAVARRYFPEAVQLRPAFITAETIDQILTEAGFGGEIDLLSIDVDGNDFWIWSAISCVTPRVVVVEYNACLGTDPVTIPYDPDFRATSTYFGVSLSALALLAETKGYVLVGVDPNGVNAFFVREDCRGPFQAVDAKDAWRPNRLLRCPEPPSGDLVDVERLLKDERTGG